MRKSHTTNIFEIGAKLEYSRRNIHFYSEDAEIKYPFSHIVTVKFGELDDFLYWCKHALSGDWRWCHYEQPSKNTLAYKFYFSLEKDLMLFILKWPVDSN